MFLRKSIVLSDTDRNSNKKAVLCLQETGTKVSGTVRLYNFQREPVGILSLGFFIKNHVYKAGLTLKSQMLYEFFLDLDKIPNSFSCAVVNFQNAEVTPILYGSSEGSDDNIYAGIISEISCDSSMQNTKKVLDKYGVDFESEDKKRIENEIDKEVSCRCENCIYKKHFFENNETNIPDNSVEDCVNIEKEYEKNDYSEQVYSLSENEKKLKENLESPKEQETCELFYDRLKPQIDKLFQSNLPENSLQELIPYSKWVKVDYEDDGDFFVFGILYDDKNSPKCICYGVPSVFEEGPPQELAGYPVWLPLDDEKGFGYWITYQDAETGEPIKVIMD